jgi:hypothetical protein
MLSTVLIVLLVLALSVSELEPQSCLGLRSRQRDRTLSSGTDHSAADASDPGVAFRQSPESDP